MFYLLTGVLTVGAIELTSLLLLLFSDSAKLTYSEIYNNLDHRKTHWNQHWQVGRVTHPYFGFVFDPRKLGVNNMGFFDNHSFPYRKSPNELTVGLFGGSVARSLARDKEARKILIEAIGNSRPALAKYEFVFLNFSVDGAKQPQQYFIFSYFLETIDISINLDGWNEIYVQLPETFPSDFPEGSEYYFQNNTRFLAKLGQIDMLRSAVYFLGSLPNWFPPLALSHSYYLTWSAFKSLALKWEATLHSVRVREMGPAIRTEKSPDSESTNIEMVNNWEKYTQMQSQLADSKGIASFFFIQPNQYVEGTKKFTEEERRIAFMPSHPPYNKRFRRLESVASRLRKKGIRVISAANVFSSIADTVYTDNCCHINRIGNIALANFMASSITEALARQPLVLRRPASANH